MTCIAGLLASSHPNPVPGSWRIQTASVRPSLPEEQDGWANAFYADFVDPVVFRTRPERMGNQMTRKLRVAVVGAGRWAERAHLPGWLRDPRVEVSAVVDAEQSVAERVAKELSIPQAFSDYRQVLEDPSIDVIDVATGNDAHFQVSWDSLDAGKHVLCEKPVHHDARETKRAADLARSNGPEDEARLHLPVLARRAVRQGTARSRFRR